MNDEQNIFRTSDFQVAAFLHARYDLFPEVEWIPDSKRAEFIFRHQNGLNLDKSAQEFFRGAIDVAAVKLFDSINRLKSILHTSKDQIKYKRNEDGKYHTGTHRNPQKSLSW